MNIVYHKEWWLTPFRLISTIYKKRQELLESGAHPQVLAVLDFYWMNHLENMEELRDSVRIRAYGQHDPLVEYRRESYLLFKRMNVDFEKWINENAERFQNESRIKNNELSDSKDRNSKFIIHNSEFKAGRNDPCPCGAKHTDGRPMKFKHCHGKNG